MKKTIALGCATIALTLQNAQAHTSHSEGMAHAGEHLWFALIPAALWVAYFVIKNKKKRG